MTTVPYTFGNESSPIPLSQLDANFAVTPNYANTAGNVVNPAQANITSVGVLTSLSVTGTTVTGNLNTSGSVSATGNVTSDNLLTGGIVSAYGTVTGASFTSGGDILGGGNISAVGIVTGSNFNTPGQASVTGNITGGNISTSGKLSAQGNITAQGIISATGNIVTAEYFVGNFLGNITGNLSVGGSNTQVLFNQNGNVGAAGGLTYNSGSNTLVVLGVVSAQGNVIGGNVLVSGQVSLGGNITANNAQFAGLVTAPTPANTTANNQVATTAFVNSKVGSLGTMAYQNSISVAITGGNVDNASMSLATISNSTISSSNIASVNILNAVIANVTIANSSISNVSLANATISNLLSPLAVTSGGIGVSSLTLNSLLVGNGSSPPQTIPPGTSGNILASNGTTWVSTAAPATIAGLGFGGTSWHAVSRSFNTAYVNSYSYPIAVSATATCAVTSEIHAYVDGQLIQWFQWQFNGCGSYGGAFIIVPPGATYQLNSGQGVYQWKELY